MRFSLDMYEPGSYEASLMKDLLILNDALPDDFAPGVGYEASLERFRRSSWGHHQAEQPPRYAGNFPYDAANNYRQMIEDLGDAVHPVEHNIAALHDYQGFLLMDQYGPKPHDLRPFEIVGTRLAVAWHDTGEDTHEDLRQLCGGVVGDIPSGEKTAEHREVERRVLKKNLELFLADVPDDLLAYSVAIITHDHSVEDTPANQLVEAAHNIGEYQTGLTAGRLAIWAAERGETGERVTQLGRIAAVVLPKVRDTRLEPVANEFPFLKKMLDEKADEHDEILKAVA